MRLGDTQSVLQITTALNLAYFSFREIRSPALAAFARRVSAIDSKLALIRSLLATIRKPAAPTPMDEATSLWIKRDVLEGEARMHAINLQGYRDPYTENLERFDRNMRVGSLSAAALGFLFLLMASLFAETEVGRGWFLLATALCLAPTVMSVAYNLIIIELLKQTAVAVAAIESAVGNILTTVVTEIVPRANALGTGP